MYVLWSQYPVSCKENNMYCGHSTRHRFQETFTYIYMLGHSTRYHLRKAYWYVFFCHSTRHHLRNSYVRILSIFVLYVPGIPQCTRQSHMKKCVYLHAACQVRKHYQSACDIRMHQHYSRTRPHHRHHQKLQIPLPLLLVPLV